MADQYDVKADISISSVQGLKGVHVLAEALTALQKDALQVGAVITASFANMRPAATAFAGAVGEAARNMQHLDDASARTARTAQNTAASLTGALGDTTRSIQRLEQAQARTTRETRLTAAAGREAAGNLGAALRSALAFAGAYVGVRAMSAAFSGLVRSSFAYGTSMDRNRIALASVLASQAQFKSAADPMAAAGRVGDAVFRQLERDALTSVASSQDLIAIYSQITGPLAGAGAKLSDIRSITNDAVSAAASLGVDFAQAARDVNLMATGVAGQDTMLFRMLRSTGTIKETTEEWNKMMQETPTKGLAALQAALGQFRASAAVYAQSLPGLTSSFGDFVARFRTAFMSGPLESLRGMLARLVDLFTRNETRITSVLTAMGSAFARLLDPALAAVERATTYLIDHWEDIAARMERATQWAANARATAGAYAPTLKTAAGVAVAARVAPGAMGALAAPVTGALSSAMGGLATSVGQLFGVISAFMGLGVALAAAAAVVLVIAGVIGLMIDSWDALAVVFAVVWSFLQGVIVAFWGLFSAALGVLMPIIKILLAIVGILGFVVGTILFGLVRMLWSGFLKPIIDGWTLIFEYLGKGLDWVYEHVLSVFQGLARLFGAVNKDLLPKTGEGTGWLDGFKRSVQDAFDKIKARETEDTGVLGAAEKGAPAARKSVVNDFRGSRIEVKQDFRQADPDRVWVQFVDGINDAAERRIASALVPDFTR